MGSGNTAGIVPLMVDEQGFRNNFESKCSMKVESNSRGFNTTVHVYEGCTKEQIDETVKATLYAHDKLQADLKMEKAKQDDLKGEVKNE